MKNLRPEFDYPIEECYKNLIQKCWAAKPEDRPSFDDIVSRLRNDQDFISGNIDENEYIEYIDFVEEYLKESQQDFESETENVDNNFFNIESETENTDSNINGENSSEDENEDSSTLGNDS